MNQHRVLRIRNGRLVTNPGDDRRKGLDGPGILSAGSPFRAAGRPGLGPAVVEVGPEELQREAAAIGPAGPGSLVPVVDSVHGIAPRILKDDGVLAIGELSLPGTEDLLSLFGGEARRQFLWVAAGDRVTSGRDHRLIGKGQGGATLELPSLQGDR